MIPAQFEYSAPATLSEALAALAQNPDAKALAGGHSLLPAMKLRLATPPALVDLRKIADLHGISANGGGWRIGAMTTHDQIANSPDLKGYHALVDAAASIGDAHRTTTAETNGTPAASRSAAVLTGRPCPSARSASPATPAPASPACRRG